MFVGSNAAVTFNGNSNVMISNTASGGSGNGNSIFSLSPNLKFTDCEPGDTNTLDTPKTYTSNKKIDIDLEKCAATTTCTTIDNKATAATVTCNSTTDSQLVGNCAAGYWRYTMNPADICIPQPVCGNQLTGLARPLTGDSLTVGCKLSKQINVYGIMTINGKPGSYRELQSKRAGDQGGAAKANHRFFRLYDNGKLTLNYLKLTWGQTAANEKGGFIRMYSGTLAINWVHFDGSKTSGTHAINGGCIWVKDGTVTIKQSTFEGFHASNFGGAMYVETYVPMTIESTTFINNDADVRFICCIIN